MMTVAAWSPRTKNWHKDTAMRVLFQHLVSFKTLSASLMKTEFDGSIFWRPCYRETFSSINGINGPGYTIKQAKFLLMLGNRIQYITIVSAISIIIIDRSSTYIPINKDSSFLLLLQQPQAPIVSVFNSSNSMFRFIAFILGLNSTSENYLDNQLI